MAAKIKDSVILVTGANRGIGRAFVETALERGAKKIYAAARKAESLKELVDRGKGRVAALRLDITSRQQIQEAVEQAADVTILINNAGISAYCGIISGPNADGAQDEMRVNYFGTMDMSVAFAPVLRKNGGGVLINIVSVAAFQSFPGFRTYCASKAAEHSLTLGLRDELAPQGTFVAGVYPGPIDTDMAAGVDMEKTSPRQMCLNVYKALEEGQDSIWPDPYAAQVGAAFRTDAPSAAK